MFENFCEGQLNLKSLDSSILIFTTDVINSEEKIIRYFDSFETNECEFLKEIEYSTYVVFLKKSRDILISRDFFCSLPIYYYLNESHFIYSTNINYIVNHKNYVRKYNSTKILEFINNIDDYKDSTFWQDINTCLPACVTSINQNRIQVKSRLSKYKDVLSPSKEHSFLELLETATFDALNALNDINSKEIFSHLSGGVDSSAISCLLGKKIKHLNTVELQIENVVNSESHFAKQVVDKYNTIHHTIAEFDDILNITIKFIKETCEPDQLMMGATILAKPIELTKRNKGKFLFTGHDADSILGSKRAFFEECLDNNEIKKVKNYISIVEKRSKIERKNIQKMYFSAYMVNLWHVKKYKKFLNFIFAFKLYSLILNFFMNKASKLFKKSEQPIKNLFKDLLVKNFVTNNANSINNIFKEVHPKYVNYFKDLLEKNGLLYNEMQYKIGAVNNVKLINPFNNIAIIDFVLSNDQEFNFYDALGKGFLRDSMKGVLPEEIRLRGNKTHFQNFSRVVFESLLPYVYSNFDQQHSIWQFVNKEKFFEILHTVKNAKTEMNFNHYITINKIIYVGIWMDNFKDDLEETI